MGGTTPLHIAAGFGTPESIKALINAGADPNVQSRSRPHLHHAARMGKPENVIALLKVGADPNALGRGGWTALLSAAFGPVPEIISLLLAAGTDASITSESGETAFDFAQKNDKLRGTAAYEQLKAASIP